jgi:hypothetical protein
MDDDLERLANDERLCRLLEHYHQSGGDDREAWQDRVMSLEGTGPTDLSRWHGQLLAASWLELNAGATPELAAGRVAGCYRVTAAGRQALRRIAARQRDGLLPEAEVRPES